MSAGNSGTFEFTYSDVTYGTHKLRFTWAETVTGMTSSVAVSKVELHTTGMGGYDFVGNFILEINGEDVISLSDQGSVRPSLNTWTEIKIGNASITGSTTNPIAHNADGTKSVIVRLKKRSGYSKPLLYSPGDIYGTGQLPFNFVWTDGDSVSIALITLNTVSTFTVTGDTMGSAITIDINRSSSSLKHTLKWAFASHTGTIATNVGTSKNWTPNANTFGGYIPNASSGTCTITCETWSGDTKLGETTQSFTLKVPSDAAPTVVSGWSSLSYSNTSTPASSIAAPVKGFSKVTWVLDVSKITLKYGATLASAKAVYSGTTVTKTASGTYNLATAASTSISVQVTVTDSRGKTYAATLTMSVYDWAAPKIKDISVYRCDSGGTADDTGSWIAVSAKGTISSINGLNAVYSFWVYTKPAGGSYGSPTTISPSGTTSRWDANLDPTKSYTVRIELMDTIQRNMSPSGMTSTELTIPTASVAFNIRDGGKGAAFGKYAESDGVLDIGDWDAVGRVLGLGRARKGITSTEDLDNYYVPGVYRISSNANAQSIGNCPSNYAGTLRVWISNGNTRNYGDAAYYLLQEYNDSYGNSWRRRGYADNAGDPITWDASWTGYGTKSSLGLGSLTYAAPASISNGSSGSITLPSSSRGMIAVCGVDDSGRDIIIYVVNGSGVVYYTAVRGASGLTLSKSTNTLTITNASGYAVYPMQFIR